MSGNVTIYLSSTYEDLKDYRRAVCDALRRSGYEVIAMEDYVAQDQRPVAKCLADVDRADIYVGLFGFRYGYVPPVEHGNPEGRSITELELRRADANPKTCCLTYCLDEKAGRLEFTDAYTGENERGARIAALREHLRREKLAPLFSAPHQLASEVQAAVSRHLRQSTPGAATSAEPAVAVTWNLAERGSPYPGLMHFTRTHASVFFGRDAEVREVLDRLWQPEVRFVLISGDSGSGKSSLVDAGVLPKLETLGLPQDRRCRSVRLVPSEGADPFDALARALHGLAQEAGFNPYALSRELAAAPEALPDRLATLMARGLNSDALVLFLDQLEELFTAASTDEQRRLADAFVTGLCRATERTDLRVIATLRSDWLPVCHRHPDLLAVLRGPGHYPLGPVEPGAMHDMIVRPARAAGLEIAESLARRLIRDAGAEPGNLPLLAFVLERLFAERKDDTLSESVYERFGGSDSETGGLKGALADYVRVVEAAIGSDPALGAEGLARLEDLFPALVVLSLAGQPTRRRAAKLDFDPVLQPIVERLVKARLLTSAGEGEAATVSVAHEKLFEAWPRLARWVEEHREELRILRQAELDASEWQRRGYDLDYLWHVRRLKGLRAIVEDLPTERVSPAVRALAQPQDRLIARLDDPALPLAQRLVIGQYLAELGDPRPGVGVHPDGTPDIAWVPIPGGYVVLEDGAGEAEVAPFAMARYPVTNAQFQAFVEARDGYRNDAWWRDLKREEPKRPRWPEANGPRETVSWYEAVAFCGWLTARLRARGELGPADEVRLPTEFQWQQAATGGDPENVYPWGAEWDATRCNSAEGKPNRTAAVGLHPHGAWPGGPLDLAGNVREWCTETYEAPHDDRIDHSGDNRAARGGSWDVGRKRCRAADRFHFHPQYRPPSFGFRVVRPPLP